MTGFESIAFSLLKTLATFIFGQVLNASTVNIDMAPVWFMKETTTEICASGFKRGGLESIEQAKLMARNDLQRRVFDMLRMSVDEIKSATDKEKTFLENFLNDRSFEMFLLKNINYKNIEYEKKVSVAFVRACVNRQELQDYEEQRVETLKKTLSIKRSEDAFEELEKEDKQ